MQEVERQQPTASTNAFKAALQAIPFILFTVLLVNEIEQSCYF